MDRACPRLSGRDGVGRDHPAAGRVERGLRAGHVGDDDVVEAPRDHAAEAGAEGVHRRGREPAEAGERVGCHRPARAALHLLAHGEGDLVQAHRRAGLPHRQVDEARGHLRPGRRVVAVVDGDRHHGADRRAGVDGLAAGEQPRAERPGDRREDDVVDGDLVGEGALAQAGADLAVVLEVGADHDVAARAADGGVERRRRGRAAPTCGRRSTARRRRRRPPCRASW